VGLIQWATSPWGQQVPTHIAWVLIWVAVFGGLAFLIVHAVWVGFFAKEEVFVESKVSPGFKAQIPAKVKKHSLTARLFHWVMALSMLALLVTAFLPKVGVEFPWVTWHWIAGLVLIASILFHVIHASFFMDFWSIWPDRTDIRDAKNRARIFMGKSAPLPRKFGKYPFENKMYHLAVVLAGLAVIFTGAFMLFRVRTPFLTRNPYLFGDTTWGWMYVLHGLAGVGFISLVMAHIYFAVRPEKFEMTKSMIVGSVSREHYLEHHDPERWQVASKDSSTARAGAGD
jgi:cytochrome b subunit of formate dehydrogenase